MPKVNGFDAIMTRHITADRVFCIIGRNGTRFLQPGRSLGLSAVAIGTCLRSEHYVPFKVKKISGTLGYECNENYSVFRVGHHGQWWLGQDSDTSDYGLATSMMTNFPNDDNDELWLFPKRTSSVSDMDVVGNGGLPAESAVHSDLYLEDGWTRGVEATGCYDWGVTVCIHSNDLQVADAMATNMRGVYVPFFEGNGSARLLSLNMKKRITAVGSSSVKFGDLMVWVGTYRATNGTQWIGDPVLRIHDGSSMIRNSYNDSSELRVETVVQIRGT